MLKDKQPDQIGLKWEKGERAAETGGKLSWRLCIKVLTQTPVNI